MPLRTQRIVRDGWIHQFDPADQTEFQDFGDRTSLVNALRNREIYARASLRLLSDLIEVTADPVKRGTPLKLNGKTPPSMPDGLLETDHHLIRQAAASSPCLFRSLALPARHRARRGNEGPTANKILLCQEDGLDLPVDALAHLLAAAIAVQFDEIAAAVTFSNGQAIANIWLGERRRATVAVAKYDALLNALRKKARTPRGRTPFFHVIVALSTQPSELHEGFVRLPRGLPNGHFGAKSLGYDRIVYLTEDVPAQAPQALVRLLADTVRRAHSSNGNLTGPFFCSFIPSIVQTKAPRPKPFATAAVDDELQTPLSERKEPPGWRLERDRCFVPFKLQKIKNDWARLKGDAGARGRTSFTSALLDQPDVRDIAYRWARAVTNRQIGVALSGGGASSYRLVPLLEALDGQVPVDVVGGDSGGALIGAYYCQEGLDGLKTSIKSRWALQAMIAIAVLHSGIVRLLVDCDLNSARVERTPVRFVPLATMLPEDGPPQAHVVTAGTLGEAVQVSGAAPLLFAPAEKRIGRKVTRFADGGIAALIPARILKDFGADMVFAFNCLPGPERCNPFDGSLLGRFAYRHTLLGRLIDLWVSTGFLTQRIGRETNEDAEVYFEPKAQEIFLLDSFLFVSAVRIARKSAHSKELKECIEDCLKHWQKFRRWETS